MERAQGMTWKDMIADITEELLSWGCRYSRKQLPEIALGYECTPLFFWNWLDDPETEKTGGASLHLCLDMPGASTCRRNAWGRGPARPAEEEFPAPEAA